MSGHTPWANIPRKSQERYVIWSFEHRMWWLPDEMGYTGRLDEAGRYPLAQMAKIIQRANLTGVNEIAFTEAQAEAAAQDPANYA